MDTLKKTSRSLAAAAALGIVVAGCTTTTEPTVDIDLNPDDTVDSNADAMMDASSEAGTAMSGQYEDGTYTATGNYTSPAGQEEVDVTVTLEGGVIIASEFTGKATNPGSVRMQGNFKEGFAPLVVGKPIDEVELTVVNGSSLAPKGFMQALEKIKAEAKA